MLTFVYLCKIHQNKQSTYWKINPFQYIFALPVAIGIEAKNYFKSNINYKKCIVIPKVKNNTILLNIFRSWNYPPHKQLRMEMEDSSNSARCPTRMPYETFPLPLKSTWGSCLREKFPKTLRLILSTATSMGSLPCSRKRLLSV